jgi:DNA invertase Pin-like site-specific DNA recombinase
MQVALYARVSTPTQHQEGTIASQLHSLRLYIQQQGWSLLPTHEYTYDRVKCATSYDHHLLSVPSFFTLRTFSFSC